MRKIDRNDPCWCGSGKKYKLCHIDFDEILLKYRRRGHKVPTHDIIKTKEQINGIRESGKVNIAILDYISEHICIGMTTEEIDRIVSEKTKEYGGIPAPLNFEGFPKSVCTSRNHEVCHGIPSKNAILRDGDIVNVDVSTIYNGFYSDSSRMFCFGNVNPKTFKLVQTAKECITIGLGQVKPWNYLGDMGAAVHDYAKKHGYSIVKEIGGHGVGLDFHEDPFVSYIARRRTGMLMVPGMVFTIEPMLNMGKHDIRTDQFNGWTVYTVDGLPSAQWEVTVLVTSDGYEILAY